MKRNIILVSLLVIAIGGIGYLIVSSFGTNDQVDVWIAVDSDGNFVPSDITIKKGTVVGWLNEREEDIWPASNLHPSHLVYSEFDPLGPIAPGDSWSFKFNKRGDWRFHDHLNPIKTGIVVVE
mgnify:CR=1 FL=1